MFQVVSTPERFSGKSGGGRLNWLPIQLRVPSVTPNWESFQPFRAARVHVPGSSLISLLPLLLLPRRLLLLFVVFFPECTALIINACSSPGGPGLLVIYHRCQKLPEGHFYRSGIQTGFSECRRRCEESLTRNDDDLIQWFVRSVRPAAPVSDLGAERKCSSLKAELLASPLLAGFQLPTFRQTCFPSNILNAGFVSNENTKEHKPPPVSQ